MSTLVQIVGLTIVFCWAVSLADERTGRLGLTVVICWVVYRLEELSGRMERDSA